MQSVHLQLHLTWAKMPSSLTQLLKCLDLAGRRLSAQFLSAEFYLHLLTLFKIRSWLANAIPESLKIAFAAGIGLFLTFIGLNDTGIITIGVPGAPVHVGNLSEPSVLLGIFSFLFIGGLMIRKINGAILIGIVVTTVLGILLKVTPMPMSLLVRRLISVRFFLSWILQARLAGDFSPSSSLCL